MYSQFTAREGVRSGNSCFTIMTTVPLLACLQLQSSILQESSWPLFPLIFQRGGQGQHIISYVLVFPSPSSIQTHVKRIFCALQLWSRPGKAYLNHPYTCKAGLCFLSVFHVQSQDGETGLSFMLTQDWDNIREFPGSQLARLSTKGCHFIHSSSPHWSSATVPHSLHHMPVAQRWHLQSPIASL